MMSPVWADVFLRFDEDARAQLPLFRSLKTLIRRAIRADNSAFTLEQFSMPRSFTPACI